jgi:hypothetical protein
MLILQKKGIVDGKVVEVIKVVEVAKATKQSI